MKPRHRPDDVRAEIVKGIRGAGALWVDLETREPGHPDGFVLWVGSVTFLELKSPGGRLSPEQEEVRRVYARHGVRVHVPRTLREALDAIGITGPRAEENRRALRSLVSDRARTKAAKGRLVPSVRVAP